MVMALSTASSPTRPARVIVDGAELCALVCAAPAGVHRALLVSHADESTRMAVAFAAAAVPLLAVATAHLLSRTSGIPGLAEHPEPFGTLGVAVSVLEVAAAIVAMRQPNPRRHR